MGREDETIMVPGRKMTSAQSSHKLDKLGALLPSFKRSLSP